MGRSKGFFLCMILVMLSTNNLLIPVILAITTKPSNGVKFEDQKNYTPDPQLPRGGHHKSPHNQNNCVTPPSPSSSGGSSGGGYYPTPSPTPPSKGGGGHHRPPKHTPTNPPKGGGCACPSPPLVSSPPPSSGGSGGYYPPTPTTPTPGIVTPPGSPLVPSPPVIPFVPSPPSTPGTPLTPYDPTNPPFPCTYWGNHPQLIFGVLGWWATIGGLWGVTTLPGLNSATSLQQVLTNPRNDGYGSLYREGTAAFLNSMAATTVFPFSTKQVKDAFLASLDSDKAAATQAKLFKLANERKFKSSVTVSNP